MSQPLLSGEQLAVAVENGVLRVTNDPGFTSDNGDGCPYRNVLLRGPVLYGRDVPKRTPATERWDSFFPSRDHLAAWRFPISPGTYTLIVWAGSFFKGWGDVPDDFIEWGADDQGKNPSGVPRVNAVTFTAPSVTPPPPPPPGDNFTELRAHAVQDLDRALATVARPKVSAPRTLAARLCLDATGSQTRAILEVLGQ